MGLGVSSFSITCNHCHGNARYLHKSRFLYFFKEIHLCLIFTHPCYILSNISKIQILIRTFVTEILSILCFKPRHNKQIIAINIDSNIRNILVLFSVFFSTKSAIFYSKYSFSGIFIALTLELPLVNTKLYLPKPVKTTGL